MRQAAPRCPRHACRCAWLLALALAAGAAPAHAGANFWTPLGPGGGGISFLAASPAQPGLLFAATCGGSVFRSEDGGASWQPASRGLDFGSHNGPCPFTPFSALVADPQTPAVVYAAGSNFGEFAVWKSVDAGATWALLPPLPLGRAVQALAIDPRSPATLYAATESGVWKSVDGGTSWTKLATGENDTFFLAIAVDPNRPSTVYAATGYRLLRSTDAGATWTERDAGLPFSQEAFGILQIAVDPATVPGTVYFAFPRAGGGNTYRSVNGGASWQPSGPGGYPLAVGQGVVYAGAVKTADGGNTWTPAATPPGGPVLALAAPPGSGTSVYAGTSQQGVWRSGDAAATWQPSSSGLAATQVQLLAIDPLHPRILNAAVADAVQGPGLFKSGNSGGRWRLIGPSWLQFYLGTLAIDPVTPATLYAGSYAGLVKSLDGGNTWNVLVGNDAATCFGVDQLAIDPSHPETLYVAARPANISSCTVPSTCPAWKSTDGGDTWTCLGIAVEEVRAFFVAAGTPATVYAIAGARGGCCGAGVFRSRDAGSSWKEADAGLHGATAAALAIDPTDANRVFAATTLGVFRTSDGGATWLQVNHKLPVGFLLPPVAVAIDPHVPATVYTAGVFGVYRSTNGGLTWYPVNGGLPEDAFFPVETGEVGSSGVLVLDPRQPGKLYAGTRHNGIYTYTVQ